MGGEVTKVAHLTTVDSSLRFLLFPQLRAIDEQQDRDVLRYPATQDLVDVIRRKRIQVVVGGHVEADQPALLGGLTRRARLVGTVTTQRAHGHAQDQTLEPTARAHPTSRALSANTLVCVNEGQSIEQRARMHSRSVEPT